MSRKRALYTFLVLVAVISWVACGGGEPATEELAQATAPAITVSPDFPADIPGGAGNANLTQASQFAWQEFIALTWPAADQTGALNTRGVPNTSAKYGAVSAPLVWETFRHKVEVFPGQGTPNGYVDDASQDYGFDAPVDYIYSSTKTGTSDGEVQPCGTASTSKPYVNLDEINEIGQNQMFAGMAPTSPAPGQQFLYLAKANRTEYVYVTANKWWNPTVAGASPTAQDALTATVTYQTANMASPPAGSTDLVSFPNGTVEMKSAWRQLGSGEDKSKFRTAVVRHYERQSSGLPCYVDSEFAMMALHIIHKTPTAQSFIFATFEYADNIVTTAGAPVEDAVGNVIANQADTPFNPNIMSKNAVSANPASPQSIQQLSPGTADCQAGQSLYYQNTPGQASTQGTICVNRRAHDIPSDVIAVNQSAHSAIDAYNSANGVTTSPWSNYKLVNVQYKPTFMEVKTPGIDYTAADAATYYLANSVVETNYNLQFFSGQFQPQTTPSTNVGGLITDFNTDGSTFFNVLEGGRAYLVGGCMGCHGNAQHTGGNFSFIFPYAVTEPEVAGEVGTGTASFRKFLLVQPRR